MDIRTAGLISSDGKMDQRREVGSPGSLDPRPGERRE